jgi:hypothetical protein
MVCSQFLYPYVKRETNYADCSAEIGSESCTKAHWSDIAAVFNLVPVFKKVHYS